MATYAVRRLGALVLVLIAASILTFLIIHLVPGDPVLLMLGPGQSVSTAEINHLRNELGFNLPLYTQYWIWVTGVLHGNFGQSIQQSMPVGTLISQNIWYTVRLAIASVIVTIVLGVAAGVVAAVNRGTWLDLGAMVVSLVGLSMPSFWLALLLIYVFAVKIQIFPVFGGTTHSAIVLPSIALGIGGAGVVARFVRSAMLEVMNQQYILVARSKGLTERVVMLKHVFRNAVIPVLAIVGLEVGYLLSGTVIIEEVFGRPGIGHLLVTSILDKDYPTVEAIVILITLMYAVTNLMVDFSYALVDPRIVYA
jgi:peptide/nickel transport system permease protein